MLRKRAEKVLGRLLPAIPGVPQMLAEIRKEFQIPKIVPGTDLKEIVEPEKKIDWKAVHKAIEERLREIPDILPKELIAFQKMVDYRETLPRKVKFSEPATPKLKIDVGILYKYFVKLYNFTVDNLAMPWIKAADNFFTVAADNLVEFLKTGIAEEVPGEWVNAVQTVSIFGEKVVIVMASDLADPAEVTEQFREEFALTFRRRKSIFTKTDVNVADDIRLRLEGMAYKDIADVHIQSNRHDFPEDEESEEYKVKKKLLEDTLKHDIRNALNKLSVDVGEEN